MEEEDKLVDGFAEQNDLTGQVLDGRYRVGRCLGAGGMGRVYRGEHVMLGTEVAIKVLLPKFAHDPEWVHRFLLEARAASKIRHPNIVQMHDFAAPRPGLVYMVMELLEGESLADLARREIGVPWPRVARMAEQVADALAAAHARGIIHRDIKPPNCFRVNGRKDPDFIKVLDFGIAKFLAGADDYVESPSTATGIMMGTPAYIAPEIFMGLRPDARADIYALGVMMYKLLTGRVPFSGNHHIVVAQQIMRDRPTPPSEVAPPGVVVTPEVDALILQMLRREPEERMATMTELIAALRASRDDTASPSAPLPVPVLLPRGPQSPLLAVEIDAADASTIPRNPIGAEGEGPIAEPKSPSRDGERADPTTSRSLLPAPPQNGAAASRAFRIVTSMAGFVGALGVAVVVWLNVPDKTAQGPEPRGAAPPISASSPEKPMPTRPVPVVPRPATETSAPPPVAAPSPAPPVEPLPPAMSSMSVDGTHESGEAISRPKRTGSLKRPKVPAPEEPASAKDKLIPQSLESDAIIRQLQGMEGGLQRDCFNANQALVGTAVNVDVAVDSSGRAQVTLKKSRASSFVGCIVEQVEKHRFPASQGGGRAVHSFVAK